MSMSARERYHHDPAFHQLVKLLHAQIEKGDFTPTEIREAAMLAQIIYEERNPRPLLIDEIDRVRRTTYKEPGQ